MLKKKLLLLFWVFVLLFSVAIGGMYVNELRKKWFKEVHVEDYAFSIAYPQDYENIEEETNGTEKFSSQISIDLTETEKATDIDLKLVEPLIHVKGKESKITLLVEGLQKEKTNMPLDEICRNYITMFKIYNEDAIIKSSNYEEVVINDVPAGRVEIYIEGKYSGIYPGMISYLFSLEEREITVVFSGTNVLFENNKKEIEKIINSVEFE